MSIVIVERIHENGISGDELLDADVRGRWCFEAHGVRPRAHCVSLDGLRVFCIIEAPDAEAVRTVGRDLKMSRPERIWTATAHGPCADVTDLCGRTADVAKRGAVVLVERSFAEPVRFDDVQSLEERGTWCLNLNRVQFLVTYFSLDRRRMICLYEAPDVDSVRRTNIRLGLPFDHAWGVAVHFQRERAA